MSLRTSATFLGLEVCRLASSDPSTFPTATGEIELGHSHRQTRPLTMNLRRYLTMPMLGHIAALALVGCLFGCSNMYEGRWYLMAPPETATKKPDFQAPISNWQ